MEHRGFEAGKEHGEGKRGEKDSGEKEGAVLVMEEVASFEAFFDWRVASSRVQ
jgi:hypothetical protein